MALKPKKVPMTREAMRNLIIAYKRQSKYATLRDYLAYRLDKLALLGEMVDVSDRDEWEGEEVALIEYLMADLRSYTAVTEEVDLGG